MYRLTRPLLITLLLAALALRAMLADGYMPDGSGVIRLCTPEGMVSVVFDAESGEVVEVDEPGDTECPWASAFFAAIVLPAPGLLPLAPSQAPLRPAMVGKALIRAPPGLPPARAPPRVSC